MLPFMARSMSRSLGFLISLRSAIALITWPDWQYPHCGTSWAIQAFCTAPASPESHAARSEATARGFDPAGADHGRQIDRTAWSTSLFRRQCGCRGLRDRFAYADICATAADIAGHRLVNVGMALATLFLLFLSSRRPRSSMIERVPLALIFAKLLLPRDTFNCRKGQSFSRKGQRYACKRDERDRNRGLSRRTNGRGSRTYGFVQRRRQDSARSADRSAAAARHSLATGAQPRCRTFLRV